MQNEEVLALLRERLLHFAASRLQREAAEDVTQETLLVLHEKYAHVSAPGELLPLAFQIVRFKMAGTTRRMVRRGEHKSIPVEDLPIASGADDPERQAAHAELRDRILTVLPKMGDRCREIFRMKLEGLSFEEIRRHFGVDSINTIYTWDLRCRRRMLELMGGHWERKS